MPRSRFRPRDPDAVHRRFEEIRSRVLRRLDDEWARLVRTLPPGDDDGPPAPTGVRRREPRVRG